MNKIDIHKIITEIEDLDMIDVERMDDIKLKDMLSESNVCIIANLILKYIKAFGGCLKCYGKGYATQRMDAVSRGSVDEYDPIIPCSCDRGKEIAKIIKNSNT